MTAEQKILIVDDDESILDCMEELSMQEGWTIALARNGRECLQLVEREKPFLILLDHRMPNMTGEVVLQELERRKISVPVIVMSAEKNLSSFHKFSSVTDIIYKPFELNTLINSVNAHIHPKHISSERVNRFLE